MNESGVKSLRASAAELGVKRQTVSDMVNSIGITCHRMTNGKARGLSPRDRRLLRQRLRPLKATADAASAGA